MRFPRPGLADPSAASEATPGRTLTIALAGNPNSGKTTLFNHLTGAHQHVGNYPGVTVEKKQGRCTWKGAAIDVVDLPGTYSLTAYSTDERVARTFITEEAPNVVVAVLDASNLERNLYLVVQLMELGVPLVLALNMSDVAAAQGCLIDAPHLSALLGGVPIVATVGHRGQGVDALMDAVLAVAGGVIRARPVPITYGQEIDAALDRLTAMLEPESPAIALWSPRWMALKLLEGDLPVRERVLARSPRATEILEAAASASTHLADLFHDSPEMVIADRRYGFISGACTECVRATVESRHTRSDQIDALVTHPALGLPIFLGLMYLVFFVTFKVGAFPMAWIQWGFHALTEVLNGLWPAASASPLRSLLVDGVIGGVGGVVGFLPSILILFLAIAVLEDSGYMARAAFVVDRWMHRIGLHGKSFIPMLIGFGCTVPAIMATRILESRRDRLTTMLVLPLVSCGARLPIYTLFVGAFFIPAWRAPVMMALYLVGIVSAVLLAKLLRSTVFRGESAAFVMELPPYRAPTLKGAVLHMWRRGWLYLRKAGTIILGVSILLWALTSYPKPADEALANLAPGARQAAALEYSAAGRIGKALEPATRPLGFDWRINTGLLGAFAAKEVFVAQMGIVQSLGSEGGSATAPLTEALRQSYTPLQAVAVMLFCLLGFPCMATVAVVWSESGSWKWPLIQWAGLTAFAYAMTLVAYQTGRVLGLG